MSEFSGRFAVRGMLMILINNDVFILSLKNPIPKKFINLLQGYFAGRYWQPFYFACGGKNKTGAGNQTPQVLDYKVVQVQPHQATLNVDYPASIQGQQNIEIRPKVDGYVEKIYVDEGSVVTRGQLLFKINAPQYEQDVRTAEAGIKTAEADLAWPKCN
jgi:multidrug efflux pump subunit AcrA (membrane-fusion protein)